MKAATKDEGVIVSPFGQIRTEDHAIEMVRRIGLCQLKLEAIQLEMNEAIQAAHARAQNASRPVLEVKNGLEALLRAYCDQRYDEFKEKRSRETLFGRYGFRSSSFIAIRGLERAKQFLGKFLDGRFLRVREDVDRAGLQAFLTSPATTSAEMERVERAGIRIAQRELWFVEPDLQKIRETTDEHG